MQREPDKKIQLKSWCSQAIEALQGCFTCTDWNVFTDSAEDLDEAVEVISDYIRFCEDTVIPKKTVKIFSNNKPWVTKDLKQLLNEKKRVFHVGTKDEQRQVQKRLKHKIWECKMAYKSKIENLFRLNDTKNAWKDYHRI